MKKSFYAKASQSLENEYSKVLTSMENTNDATKMEEYALRLDSLSDSMKQLEELKSKSKTISNDVLFQGGISLVSILLILKYEKLEIITSKAFGLATKMIGK